MLRPLIHIIAFLAFMMTISIHVAQINSTRDPVTLKGYFFDKPVSDRFAEFLMGPPNMSVMTKSGIIKFAAASMVFAWMAWFPLIKCYDRLLKQERIDKGLCTACGFDLQGTPDKLCPECGQAH